MADLRIAAAGDAALLVEFPARLDSDINEAAVALGRALSDRHGAVLRDVVVGYCSVTVYFDPLAIDEPWLEEEIRTTAAGLEYSRGEARAVVDIPVCYAAEFGPDLAAVAAFGHCSEEEVVRLHASRTYRVYLLGFVPGFPYMAEVDGRIAAPRRPTPRTSVPAGSVGIAAQQTGIYPSETPGGWNIIGRTPARLFDLERADPFLLQAGDRVRFQAISRARFEAFA